MSIELMTTVWRSGAYNGGTLLVLLALADWGNDAGERIYPNIVTVAEKARLSVRQVKTVLKVLEEDGILIDLENGKGGRGKRLNYRMDVGLLHKLHAFPGEEKRSRKPRNLTHETSKDMSEIGKDVPPYIEEPSSNHQDNHQENHEPGSALVIHEPVLTDLDKAIIAFNAGAESTGNGQKGSGWARANAKPPAGREKAIKARLGEVGLDGWIAAVARASESDFLAGRSKRSSDHASWRVDLGWFAKAENFTKIVEGKFDNGGPGRGPGGSSTMNSAFDGIAAALRNREARHP